MRTNPVKQKLREGKPTFGTWLSLGDLYATRVLARMGWDWMTLDIEHSAIDWSQAAMIFGCIADAGGVPLARVPKGNHDYIKRVLDAGAWLLEATGGSGGFGGAASGAPAATGPQPARGGMAVSDAATKTDAALARAPAAACPQAARRPSHGGRS